MPDVNKAAFEKVNMKCVQGLSWVLQKNRTNSIIACVIYIFKASTFIYT